jgi:hypothetical protein
MKRQRAQELRAAVDRLPLSTRHAMLQGIDRKPIIVGADGNLGGGVCPMLAASGGSQKEVGKPFARAWDRYARVKFSRRATERELLTLRTMLVASIEAQTESPVDLRDGAMLARRVATEHKAEPAVDLEAAIAEHEATKERNEAASRPAAEPREAERRDTGERDRTDELSGRHGWAWLRPFRSYDDYERVLDELREEAESRLAAGSGERERELAARN